VSKNFFQYSIASIVVAGLRPAGLYTLSKIFQLFLQKKSCKKLPLKRRGGYTAARVGLMLRFFRCAKFFD
jgi:hypothetical protein